MIDPHHDIEVKEAMKSLAERFPTLTNIMNEPGFSGQCKITHGHVDRLIENLDQIGDTDPLSLQIALLKTSNEVEECNACGGGPGVCGRMARTFACMGISAFGGWVTFLGGMWLCGCTFCPEDLPSWAC